MKKLLLVSVLAMIIVVAGCAKKPAVDNWATSWDINTGAQVATGTKTQDVSITMGSDIKISADQMASWEGSKVGGTHSGTVNLLPESYLSIDSSGSILGGKIVVAMNTITSTDVIDTGMNEKLVTHLKGEDFFDIANHPTAVFAAKSVSANGITMDATIRGITKELTFPVTLVKDGEGYLLSADIEIARSDFKIGDSLLGKVALTDTFKIKLDKVAFFR